MARPRETDNESGVWNLGRMRHRFDANPELIDAIRMPGLPAGSTASLGATLWKTCGRPVDDPRLPTGWRGDGKAEFAGSELGFKS
jgi:hypothetical protein